PVRVQTRLFGTLSLSFALAVRTDTAQGRRVAWTQSMTFPGLRPGELLTRRTTLPRRAPLLARDGSVLAEGLEAGSQSEQARSSPLGSVGTAAVGSVGTVPSSRRAALEADGVPSTAVVGVSGAEEALDERLRGTPGGALLASAPHAAGAGRVLAYAAPHPAPAVRSTISPALQQAVVSALGGQYGGI